MICIFGDNNRTMNKRLCIAAAELLRPEYGPVRLLFLDSEQRAHHSGYPADQCVLLVNRAFNGSDYESYVETILSMLKTERPQILLFPSTVLYREVASIISVRASLPLLTDCTGLRTENGFLYGTKPSLDREGFDEIRFPSNQPVVIITRFLETTERKVTSSAPLEVRTVPLLHPGPLSTLHVLTRPAPAKHVRDAELIFSGGRGLMSQESFDELIRLAGHYDAAFGCSRPVVDLGWTDISAQIGQTGSFVHPRVYLAFGISGAVQHIAGIRDSGCIIAVNINPASPIFRYSDYGICADANSIIRNMLRLLEETLHSE